MRPITSATRCEERNAARRGNATHLQPHGVPHAPRLGVARLLGSLDPERVEIIEVHPGATSAFGGLHWDRRWHSRRSQITAPCYWIGSEPRAPNRFRALSRTIISWPPWALRSQHGRGGGGTPLGSHRPSHHFIRSPSLARIAGACHDNGFSRDSEGLGGIAVRHAGGSCRGRNREETT